MVRIIKNRIRDWPPRAEQHHPICPVTMICHLILQGTFHFSNILLSSISIAAKLLLRTIDKDEFKKVMTLMGTHNRQGALHKDGLHIALKVLILWLEFVHYDYKLQGTIAKDFALSMVASADMRHINKFLDRVEELNDGPNFRAIRITFEEFKNLAELRKRLRPLSLAIFIH
ncbi:hypothetical protein HYC85_003608 [Camellia sinensis]|uniref:Uncharacterized protein n=1 Tax=Camellia sinensis TaxID=4442 RepID=A0A7J7HU59_CAMSI|nr:hypothetical protein HYC85_003608 [Camellia sinensis]